MCILYNIIRPQARTNKTLAVDAGVRKIEYCSLAILRRDKFILSMAANGRHTKCDPILLDFIVVL